MRKIFSRIMTGIIILSLLAMPACHVNDARKVTTYSDLPKTHWGYETIMYVTD